MENAEFMSVINKCKSIFLSASSYQDVVNKISDEYNISCEDIVVHENEVFDSIKNLSDEDLFNNIADSLAFANNSTAVCQFFNKLQNAIYNIDINLFEASFAESTQAVNRNPKLHGFLFEEIHAAVFNMRSKIAEKPYVARVLKPSPGTTYAKNSVDIIIRDTKLGRDVCRYQAKCCQDAEATNKAIHNGNYNNQRLLVPEEQVSDVKKEFSGKTVASVIEYDGISSNPISYNRAKELQYAIQNDDFSHITWDEFSAQDIFMAGVKSLATPVLVDAIIRTTFGIAEKLVKGNEQTWQDSFIKIGQGVSLDATKLTFTTIAKLLINMNQTSGAFAELSGKELYAISSVVVDTIADVWKFSMGEQSIDVTIDNIAKNVVVASAQYGGMLAGEKIGSAMGSFIGAIVGVGPVGVTIGSVAGGLLGSILAGSGMQEAYKKIKEMCNGFVKNSNIHITSGSKSSEKMIQKSKLEGVKA